MIFDATDLKGYPLQATNGSTEIFIQTGLEFAIDKRSAVFGSEDYVKDLIRE